MAFTIAFKKTFCENNDYTQTLTATCSNMFLNKVHIIKEKALAIKKNSFLLVPC